MTMMKISRTAKFQHPRQKFCRAAFKEAGFMVTDAKEFGAAIRRRRKELGYTQAFLSDFSGFSVTFISDLENGKSTAELGKSIYLANLLGLDCTLTPRS